MDESPRHELCHSQSVKKNDRRKIYTRVLLFISISIIFIFVIVVIPLYHSKVLDRSLYLVNYINVFDNGITSEEEDKLNDDFYARFSAEIISASKSQENQFCSTHKSELIHIHSRRFRKYNHFFCKECSGISRNDLDEYLNTRKSIHLFLSNMDKEQIREEHEYNCKLIEFLEYVDWQCIFNISIF